MIKIVPYAAQYKLTARIAALGAYLVYILKQLGRDGYIYSCFHKASLRLHTIEHDSYIKLKRLRSMNRLRKEGLAGYLAEYLLGKLDKSKYAEDNKTRTHNADNYGYGCRNQ